MVDLQWAPARSYPELATALDVAPFVKALQGHLLMVVVAKSEVKLGFAMVALYSFTASKSEFLAKIYLKLLIINFN